MPEESAPVFIENGKVLEGADPESYPVLAAGLTEDKAIHVFSSAEEFFEWAKSTSYAAQISVINTKAEEARRHADDDHSEIRAMQQKRLDRVREDMEALARRTGLHPASHELFRKATLESEVLEGPVFDPATIFDYKGRGGLWGPYGGWSGLELSSTDWSSIWKTMMHIPNGFWPDFTWWQYPDGVWPNFFYNNWNDKISSIRISGIGVFYEHTWFQGRHVWLVGWPWAYYGDLGPMAFDNRISSAIIQNLFF